MDALLPKYTKKFLPFFLAVSFFSESQAQSWCPPGAKWHFYVRGFLGGTDGYAQFKYTGDTVVNNRSCKIIRGTFTGFMIAEYPYTLTDAPFGFRNVTYESNGVIYSNLNGILDTILNYGAAVGDKWLSCKSCTNSVQLTVTSTGTVIINNVSLRKIGFKSNPADLIEQVRIEKISPLFNYQSARVHSGEDYTSVYWCAYEDNNFALYNSGGYGCSALGVADHGGNDSGIPAFPNPVKDVLNILLPHGGFGNEYEVRITDCVGRLITVGSLPYKASEQQLDLGAYSPGIYFLNISSEGKTVAVKKIVKE